jgi:tetratricopeptide (TPR) repeat protein
VTIRGVFICILLLPGFLIGCGYGDGKRDIRKARDVLTQEEQSIEELTEVRGRLKRIIDLKVSAVNQLEDVDRVLGRKYLIAGSYNLARDVLEEAEYLKPYSAFIKKDLGECYYFLGASSIEDEERRRLFEQSRQYYLRALDIRSDLTEARYGLSLLLYFGFNDVDGAIEQMKQVLEQDERNIDARFALGRYYYEIGEYSKALGEYLEITRILPKSSPRRIKAEDNIIRINRELETSG